MRPYPMFLNLEGCRCLVVGAGGVGRRKLAGLIPCSPAEVLVLDLSPPDAELAELVKAPCVVFQERSFRPEDADGRAVVFAATGSREVNAAVALACRQRGIPCNVIDDPSSGSFIVPAHFTCGDMLVALSTGGQSPALARRIRMDLEQWFGNRYCHLATLMGRVRPLVLALGNETGHNATLFRSMVNSALPEAFAAKDRARCEALLCELLPVELHPHIVELLHELV